MNGNIFTDDLLSAQKLMSSFVHLLWYENKVFLDDPTTLVNFIDRVGE